MFDRIKRILNSLGLAESYLKNFEDNAMDDDTVGMCFQNENDLAALKEVIPLTGHRMRFIRAFREKLAEPSNEIVRPNESPLCQGIDFSSGSLGTGHGGQGSGTTVLGAPDHRMTNSSSFGQISSGQGWGEQAAKYSLLDQSGQLGESNVTGNNNSVHTKPLFTSGLEGEQSGRGNITESKGKSEDGEVSMESDDTFQNFGVVLGESLNLSVSSGRSVQIMGFEEATQANAVRKTVFFEEEFRRVIEKCDPTRPVAVLAVAGQATMGKSLFFSYALGYLKALEQGNQDWIGWSDTTMKPLEGFRWANGYEIVTKGIWTWSEPITRKNSKGQEFDVLLMDMEGVFDETTVGREWAILAGMGLLISSIMVLNTSNGVQEDTLKSIQNFLSFGLPPFDRNEISERAKPFQNLVFLVHDWENHEEFPFGNQGGRKFIERKLEEKPDHDYFHRKLRREVKTGFENIDCFLFPNPGLATGDSSFTGAIVNATPEYRDFARQMQLGIEQLLNSDRFPFKTQNGNNLNAPDIFAMFKSYIEMFNLKAEARSAALKHPTQRLGESTGMNKARNEGTTQLDAAVYEKALEQVQKSFEAEQMILEIAIGDGVRLYKTSMDKLLLSSRTTEQQQDPPTDDVENFHLQSESAALEKLAEFFKVNSEKFKKPAEVELRSKKLLCDRIVQAYADWKLRNELKSQSFQAQVAKFLSQAQQEFTDEMKQLSLGINDEATLTSMACELKSRVKSKFEHRLDMPIIDETTWNEHLSRLDSHMDYLVGQHVRIIQLTRQENELAVKGAMEDARKFYTDQMKNARESKSWYPTEEFKRINDGVLEATVKKFSKEGEGDLTPQQAEILQESLQGLYSRFEEENDSFIPKESHAIGIDLGTTYSCVGVYVNGKVEIIQENEKFTIPSCVYYDEGSRRAVGEAAQDGAFMSPEDFIFDAKRLIGRSWNDQVVQDDIKQWNFRVVKVDDQPRIKCRVGVLRPEQVSAEVLAHLKSLAEKHLGQKVTRAVVTIPAYFNEGQRQATKDAARLAGLTAKILTEPVAAAIAYRLDRAGDLNKNVLVFDLGGGTFDVAVLTISGRNIDVKTINGDTHLGGEDFDKAMVKHVINKVKAKSGRDLLEGKNSSNPDTRKKVNNILRRLKLECERKKRDLSSVQMVHIRLEEVGWNLDETMMRSEFENLIHGYLVKCMTIVSTALKDAKMSKNDIDDIVLVGGSTKIPKVHEMLKDYFNGIQLKHTVNPDQAVAFGAAIQAAIKSGSKQGHGIIDELFVQDVLPFALGIENLEGQFIVQVPKDSNIPFSCKQRWQTGVHYQTENLFAIYEGVDPVHPIASENRLLGEFNLNTPPMKKGAAKMDVTTVVDDEGIVSVKAVCLINGAENDIVIDTNKGRMSEQELQDCRIRQT